MKRLISCLCGSVCDDPLSDSSLGRGAGTACFDNADIFTEAEEAELEKRI